VGLRGEELIVLTQYRRMTNRRTDRHVAVAKTSANIASRG